MPANARDVDSSLGQKDPLEKEMATHSSILAWEIPWTETWWATAHGSQRVGHDIMTKSKNSNLAFSSLVTYCLPG